MPTMPPRARAEMLSVAAVPRRKDGTESAKATTAKYQSQHLDGGRTIDDLLGITVVTAVPRPNSAEKA